MGLLVKIYQNLLRRIKIKLLKIEYIL